MYNLQTFFSVKSDRQKWWSANTYSIRVTEDKGRSSAIAHWAENAPGILTTFADDDRKVIALRFVLPVTSTQWDWLQNNAKEFSCSEKVHSVHTRNNCNEHMAHYIWPIVHQETVKKEQ